METNRIILGDCVESMASLPDCSVDAVVTDPPYELGFMNKSWDASGIAYNTAMWEQVYRVLKPGGHLLSFGGSRTYHRMACAIEDAGFEVRDQLMFVYGSGFPKSLDVSKAIDKAAGAEREVVGGRRAHNFAGAPGSMMTGHATEAGQTEIDITAPATQEAQQWDGWGTALKPAHEPIVLARKPFNGTVVQNVLKWFTGALNIAGCRIEHDEPEKRTNRTASYDGPSWGKGKKPLEDSIATANPAGRFPSNLILDQDAGVLLDEQSGELISGAMLKPYEYTNTGNSLGAPSGSTKANHDSNTGGASRFFYCAKPSRRERNAGLAGLPEVLNRKSGKGHCADTVESNIHPTVKPISLMRYLCRLITPPGGVVLDPFTGSGTTLCAAVLEGFQYVGCELSAEYIDIAQRRVAFFDEHGEAVYRWGE